MKKNARLLVNTRLLLGLFWGFFLFDATCLLSVFASSTTVRCGKGFVSVGDTKAEATQKCGKPESKDKSTIPKSRSHTGKAIKVEEWTYNFGADRFMKRLRFEDGRLRGIESLGRGN